MSTPGAERGNKCLSRSRLVLASALLVIAAVASWTFPISPARGMVDCGRIKHEPPPSGHHRYVVAAIGDSLTDQRIGGGRYLAALAKRCPQSRFDAYGVGGQRTNHMRWRFLHDVFGIGARGKDQPQYTHVIVLGGINDLSAASMYGVDLRDIQKNLSYMYRAARVRGVQLVALTLPPWGYVPGGKDRRPEATHQLNAWILAEGQAGRVAHVVDVHPLLSCGDPDALCPRYRIWKQDAIHWNEAGHEVVADALYREVFADCL
jgi:lysophospholipase L1-like esterase